MPCRVCQAELLSYSNDPDSHNPQKLYGATNNLMDRQQGQYRTAGKHGQTLEQQQAKEKLKADQIKVCCSLYRLQSCRGVCGVCGRGRAGVPACLISNAACVAGGGAATEAGEGGQTSE